MHLFSLSLTIIKSYTTKRIMRISYFFSLLLVTISCLSCHGQSNEYLLSVAEFAKKLKETPQAQLVDVRTPEEFTQDHLPGAINIDWRNQSFGKQISSLDKSKPVFLYCRSGRRSATAAEKMRKEGFLEVYDLKGGIIEWKTESEKHKI